MPPLAGNQAGPRDWAVFLFFSQNLSLNTRFAKVLLYIRISQFVA